MTALMARLARVCRRHANRRWAVVLVFPPTDDLGRLDVALHKNLTRAEADRMLVDAEANCLDDREPNVMHAVLNEGAYFEVRELDRWGFVVRG